MLKSYTFKYKDDVVGIISYDREKNKYYFDLDNDYQGILPVPMYGLPPQDRTIVVQSKDILDFIKHRIFPENRDNINKNMRIAGLTEYNAWDIFISNLGVHMGDFFWVDTGGLDYKEFHPRLKALQLSDKERKAENIDNMDIF